MADYIRFEVLVPRIFKVVVKDTNGNEQIVPRRLPMQLETDFVHSTIDEFEGLTQSHPTSPIPLKGWWKPKQIQDGQHRQVIIDHLTYFFCLVRVDEEQRAFRHFEHWQKNFANELSEDVIFISYFQVQTIGDYF